MKKEQTAEVPAGAKKENAGAPTADVSPQQWAEVERKIESVYPRLEELADDIAALKKQIPELFESLSASVADAELVALRRLAAMGIPAGSVPSVASSASVSPVAPKTLAEQLDAIPMKESLKRRRFLAQHRAELYAEAQAGRERGAK